MRIIEDTKLDYSDVLIVPKRSELTSRKEVNLIRNYTFLNSKASYSGVPIISSNMDQTGTIEMADALNDFEVSTALHKHYSAEDLVNYFKQEGNLSSFYSMGISDSDFEKFKHVYAGTDGAFNKICIDVANGYTKQFEEFVSRIREEHPNMIIMAGSVVTPEMTEQLLRAGADIVRVGIGSGSVCTTRKLTGVGYPQLSAVIECADAAHGLRGHICADGGCQMPGDIAKAFGAGADFVMIGGMMAGHEECGGEKVYDLNYPISKERAIQKHYRLYIDHKTDEVYKLDGNDTTWSKQVYKAKPTHMKFYGMSSSAAMQKYSGGVAEYRASEGKEVLVPYRGSVDDTIKEILGGLRSACTYTGSKTLKELPKRTTFIKVNHTHNTVFGDEK